MSCYRVRTGHGNNSIVNTIIDKITILGHGVTCKVSACSQAATHGRHPDVKPLSTYDGQSVFGAAMKQQLLVCTARQLHFMATQAVLGPQVGVLYPLYPHHMRKSAAETGRHFMHFALT